MMRARHYSACRACTRMIRPGEMIVGTRGLDDWTHADCRSAAERAEALAVSAALKPQPLPDATGPTVENCCAACGRTWTATTAARYCHVHAFLDA